MDRAVLKQNRERIVQREIFSDKFKTLSSLIGSNVATSFALLKMAFYDVKSQASLLQLKGLEVKPNGKRNRYNEYLDYITASELKYLNKGLDEILNKLGKQNSDFSGFPFMFNEIIEVGRNLRYDFMEEFGVTPEQVAPEQTSVKQVKKYLGNVPNRVYNGRPYKTYSFDQKSGKIDVQKVENNDTFDNEVSTSNTSCAVCNKQCNSCAVCKKQCDNTLVNSIDEITKTITFDNNIANVKNINYKGDVEISKPIILSKNDCKLAYKSNGKKNDNFKMTSLDDFQM